MIMSVIGLYSHFPFLFFSSSSCLLLLIRVYFLNFSFFFDYISFRLDDSRADRLEGINSCFS